MKKRYESSSEKKSEANKIKDLVKSMKEVRKRKSKVDTKKWTGGKMKKLIKQSEALGFFTPILDARDRNKKK